MKNKGFTLIELLAVIVILAIIALIATPIILNIINDSRKEATIRSAENYKAAAELAVARYQMNNPDSDFIPETCNVLENGNLDCKGTTIVVEVDGETPTSGTITFTNGKISKVENLKLNETTTVTTNQNGKLEIVQTNDDLNTDTEPTIPTVTYSIGDEIRLPGSTTYLSAGESESNCLLESYDYTKWNIIKETDTEVVLYSYGFYSLTGNSFVDLDVTDFNNINACSSHLGSYYYLVSEDNKSYYYNEYTLNLPGISDFSSIGTQVGSNFTLSDTNYAQWFNRSFNNVIALNPDEGYCSYVSSETNVTLYAAPYVEGNGPAVGALRPIITLSKSDIPNQSQFN